MQLKVKLQVNKRVSIVATVEDAKIANAIKQVNPLLAFDGKCGVCGLSNIYLNTKTAKGFDFTEFVCSDCGARASWGQYKEGGYFLKKFEQYKPVGTSTGTAPEDTNAPPF